MQDWKTLFANPRFRGVWLALLGIHLSSWSVMASLPILVAERYGAGGELVLSLGLRVLPKILLAPLSGAMQRRFGSARIAGLAVLGGAALTAVLPWCHGFVLLQCVIAGIGVLDIFIMPGLLSLRPQILPRGLEMAGNTVVSIADRLSKIVGPMFAGLIVLAGFAPAFGLFALVAAIAAVPVLRLAPPPTTEDTPQPTWQFFGPMGEFAGLLKADRALLALLACVVAYMVMVGGLRPFLFWANREWYSGNDAAWTGLLAAQGTGALIGALLSGLLSRWMQRLASAFMLTMWTAVAENAMHLSLLLAQSPRQAMLLLALGSIPEMLSNVTWFTALQERLTQRQQVAFYSFATPLWDCAYAVGILSASLHASGLLPLSTWWAMLVLVETIPLVPILLFYRGIERDGLRPQARKA